MKNYPDSTVLQSEMEEGAGMSGFIPKIVAFCCDQSGYPAADQAGALHLLFPDNVEIVRVPCAGRIETISLLKVFEHGADGVLLFACHEENCQFVWENRRARRRLEEARRRLESIGLEKERLEICSLATLSWPRFVDALRQKSEQLKNLGPHPIQLR